MATTAPHRAGPRPRTLRRLAAATATVALGLGGLLAPVAASAATTELIANGTFESGATGWSAPFGGALSTSADAASGAQSLEVGSRTSFQSGPGTDVTGLIAEGTTYDVSASVKFDTGRASQAFNITLCTSNRSSCAPVASATATAGEWTSLTGTFEATRSDYAWLFVETPWNTDVASFRIDDVSLAAQDAGTDPGDTEAPAVEGNLLPDGRFVDGYTGWTAVKGGTLALDDDSATGAHSLKVTGRTASQSGPYADVTGVLESGASYRLTGKLKYTEGTDGQRFNFTFCPSNFNGCADYGQAFTLGEWGTFTVDFTAEDRHETMAWLFVETPWGSGALQDFAIDEVSLVKTADAPEEPEYGDLEKVQTKPLSDHNPLVGHKFGADPHHLVYNGRLYIYSTNDTQQYEANSKDADGLPTQSNGYGAITTLNVMSTDDMVNWVDHGTVPVARTADAAASWAGNSWAPAAIEKDGEVYLYFCDSGTGTAVVVGGSPLGPWEDPLGKKIIPDTVDPDYIASGGFPQGMWLFDPEIFIDDDGQAYLYFGGNSVIGASGAQQGPQNPKSTRVVKLEDDLVTLDGDPVEIDAPGMFEASSLFKRGDTYYYSYSSNFSVVPEAGAYPQRGAIAYMMTDDPMELDASKYAGEAFLNPATFFGAGNGGNNHSDMFEYQGKVYFTYHAQTVGAAWAAAYGKTGQTQGYRSVHLDEVEFNADGTIKPIQGTRSGVEQIHSFDPYRTFEAETLAWQLGIKTAATDRASAEFPEHNGGGNMVVSSIDADDFTGVSQVDFGDGAASVTATVKALAEGTSIEVRLDDPDGPLAGTIDVDSAVGEWAEVGAELTGAEGVHDVFFVFRAPADAGDVKLMDVDAWAFEAADGVEPDTTKPVVTLEGGDTAVFDGNDVQFTVNATDDVGVVKVVGNIYQDGTLLKSTQSAVDGAASASHTIDLSTVVEGGLPLGDYVLRYNAKDAAGNTAQTKEFAFTLTDRIRPEVTLDAPTTAGPHAKLTIRVSATDNWGLEKIVANIYRDGTLVKSTQSAASGAASAVHDAVVSLPDGAYTIKYNARDLEGNISKTSTFAVTLDATKPTVSVKTGVGETIASGGAYDIVSFKLYDAGKIDKVTINGTVKNLSDNAWSDVNYVKPGTFGAVRGANELVVYDLAGNTTTIPFTLN